VCDRDANGAPSIFKVIRSGVALTRMLTILDLRCVRTPRVGSGTGHGHVAQAELLNLHKSCQFPVDLVKIEDTRIHFVSSQTY
jgi:hypothetical protein